MTSDIGIVIIGRNEGARLEKCLATALAQSELVVYVDSGSTDRSVEQATQAGALVVELDQTIPFTAARARNIGYQKIRETQPDLEFCQFVDGDCSIDTDWIATGRDFLRQNSSVAAVCGWRREKFPDHSIYNQLCDWEWAVPPGPAKYCGGDVMIRVSAFAEVGGYLSSLIAGEEPELCVRLRKAGWQIHVLPVEMTFHDAAMTHFSQWWKRMQRSGYAYAAGTRLHGSSPERHWVRETLRPWFWVAVPLVACLSLWPWFGGTALAVLFIYPLQVLRSTIKGTGTLKDRLLLASFNTLARFPELVGQLQLLRDLATGRSQIIEYK